MILQVKKKIEIVNVFLCIFLCVINQKYFVKKKKRTTSFLDVSHLEYFYSFSVDSNVKMEIKLLVFIFYMDQKKYNSIYYMCLYMSFQQMWLTSLKLCSTLELVPLFIIWIDMSLASGFQTRLQILDFKVYFLVYFS